MTESQLNAALRQFEATEANLVKADKVLNEILAAIPEGIAFIDDPEYESNCRCFHILMASLPKIDQWKPEISLMSIDEIAQSRFDAQEIGDIDCVFSVERQIQEPSRLLAEYRFRFSKKRSELIREAIIELIDSIDGNLRELSKELVNNEEQKRYINNSVIDELSNNASQIITLLGSSVSKPKKWPDLVRHIHFREVGDLQDIINLDWPSIKAELRKSLFGEKEPIPVEVDDLGALVSNKPKGPVATKLQWEHLAAVDFERLIFSLISDEQGYENPQWLMNTNAPDRGRDLSVYRVHEDRLSGTTRQRIIIQCKHWLSKSVGPMEVASLREQMKTWEPPRVDVNVIATSGRFTSDAVTIIEKQNQSDSALRIEMWPESHLERLLASRPAIIAQFSLR